MWVFRAPAGPIINCRNRLRQPPQSCTTGNLFSFGRQLSKTICGELPFKCVQRTWQILSSNYRSCASWSHSIVEYYGLLFSYANASITLFRFITTFYSTDMILQNILRIEIECGECFVEYRQSRRWLLWIWIMLCLPHAIVWNTNSTHAIAPVLPTILQRWLLVKDCGQPRRTVAQWPLLRPWPSPHSSLQYNRMLHW